MNLKPDTSKDLQDLLQEKRRELLEVQSDIETLERILGKAGAGDLESPDPGQVPQPQGGTDSLIGKSFNAQLTHAIQKVLLEERPLHRSDILERVEEAGLEVLGSKAKKPVNIVGNVLSTDPRFTSAGAPGYWTLAESPVMPDVEEEEEGVEK